MFGRKKMYKKGLADAMQAYEGFADKQKAALDALRQEVKTGNIRIEDALNSLGEDINGVYAYLTSREKAALYQLSTPLDLKELGEAEQRLLLAVLYQLADDEGTFVTEAQRNYIRSVQRYLEITNPQVNIDLSVVGGIDSLEIQKVFLQVVLEFFYLQNQDELTDEQEDFLGNFSVNRKQAELIENQVSRLYNAVGVQGLAEKYGYVEQDENEDESIESMVAPTNIVTFDTKLSKIESLISQGRLKEACPLLEQLISPDMPRAYYYLGLIYQMGNVDIPPEKQKASKYLSEGSSLGDVPCQNRCAINHFENCTMPWEEIEGALKEMADRGDGFAQFELAIHYLNGKNPDYVASANLLKQLADKGFLFAEYSLGLRYERGEGVLKDLYVARTWYEKAFLHGHFQAGYHLLTDLVFGENDRSNKTLKLAKELIAKRRFQYQLRKFKQEACELPAFGYAGEYSIYISLPWNLRGTHNEKFRSKSSAINVINQDIRNAIDYANEIFSKDCDSVQQLKKQYQNFIEDYRQGTALFLLGEVGNDSEAKGLFDLYFDKINEMIEDIIERKIQNLRFDSDEININYDDLIFNFGEQSMSGNSFFARLNAEYEIVGGVTGDVDLLMKQKFKTFAKELRQEISPIFRELEQKCSELISKYNKRPAL